MTMSPLIVAGIVDAILAGVLDNIGNIIVAVVGFAGAILAVLLAHWLSRRRVDSTHVGTVGVESGGSRAVQNPIHFMANRRKQEDKLREIIRATDAESPKPLVIILHGDENDSIDQYRDRLVTKTLRELLKLPLDLTFADHFLRWPSDSNDAAALKKAIMTNLAVEVLDDGYATIADIQERLAETPGAVMIWTHVSTTKGWSGQGIQRLEAFLQCWQDWPALVPGQRLIICWQLGYQVLESKRRERRSDERTNSQISEALEAFPYGNYPRVDFAILPRLEGIEEKDVHDWRREKATRIFYKEQELAPKIREIFQRWKDERGSDRIPMEDLAVRLSRIPKADPSI